LQQKKTFTVLRATLDAITPSQALIADSSSLIVDSSTEEIAAVTARPQHARRPPRHSRRPFASLPVHSTQTAHSTLATEDIGPESEEVAAEDVVDPLLSMDSDPLVSVAQDSQEPDEVIVLLAASLRRVLIKDWCICSGWGSNATIFPYE
jgi:hypothetical protein